MEAVRDDAFFARASCLPKG